MKRAPEEPNDVNNEDCGALWSGVHYSGNWNDYSCAAQLKAICEKSNYTATLIIIIFQLGTSNISIFAVVLVISNISGYISIISISNISGGCLALQLCKCYPWLTDDYFPVYTRKD